MKFSFGDTLGLALISLALVGGAHAQTSTVGPVVGISESRSIKGCQIILLRDGSRFNADKPGVRAGGKCPADFINGSIANNRTVRLADGRVCSIANDLQVSCAVPGAAAKAVEPLGPIVGVSESRTVKGCQIILLRDGSRFNADKPGVRAGGKCPADFVDGAIINSRSVRLADQRVCTYNAKGNVFCGLPGKQPLAISALGPIVGASESRTIKGCQIVLLRDGTRYNVDGKGVRVGGKCPPDFINGKIIDSETVRLADKRICYVKSGTSSVCVAEDILGK